MSASEVHLPGRPRDRAGVKALAVAAQWAWSGFRPGGVKVRGGSLICEPVLTQEDLTELTAEGVRYMKVGFGAFADPLGAVPPLLHGFGGWWSRWRGGTTPTW